MRIKKSIEITKEKNGISFETKNIRPIRAFLEKGSLRKDIKKGIVDKSAHFQKCIAR